MKPRISEDKEKMVKRVAEELKEGEIINLGIGIPNLVVDYLPFQDMNVMLHTENGLLGMGPQPVNEDQLDPNIVNAAKQYVTARPGSAYFSSADSFAMIRGGHVDVVVIGSLQVSKRGDIANWKVPGMNLLGVGGAMDLCVGAKKIIVVMTHLTKKGRPKILNECTLPLTARSAASMIITELAVFKIEKEELLLKEIQEGATLKQIRDNTAADFTVDTG